MLFVGIDWSDLQLDYLARTAGGQVLATGRVEPKLAGMGDLFSKLEAHAAPSEIAIAVETSHGAWVQALLDRGYAVYPVNPKCIERFRGALSVAGNKSDRIDCKVLAMMLATLHGQLKPLRPDDPEIVTLRIACQDRVRLVEERTAKINELHAVLKAYYPAFAGLFGNIDSAISLQFLQDFPTQAQMRSLTSRQLRSWLKRHGYTSMSRFEEMEKLLTDPMLPVAIHLQAARAALIRYLASSLLNLKTVIAEREQEINDHFDAMPEADWIRSLPGAGPNLAPALLACLGRDPDRFADVAEARAFMGTAPVTKASGKTRVVHFRFGCWKFARRTLQLFADHSRDTCAWAQALYQQKRACGNSHQAALRILAHKWLKILLALKRTRQLYDDHKFTHNRAQRLLNPRTAHA
jgi:transposase